MRMVATRRQRGLIVSKVEIGLNLCKRVDIESVSVQIIGNLTR